MTDELMSAGGTDDRRSELNALLAAEKAGANSRAVQRRYSLPLEENNPHRDEELFDAYHRGYEMEKAIGG